MSKPSSPKPAASKPQTPTTPAPKLPPIGASGAKNLLSGAGGSIGSGHSTAGGSPLSNLVPGAKKSDGKSASGDNITAKHNFNNAGPSHGKNAAKGGSGGGTAVPRRTAPGA